jgi:membrane protein YqaA with SNARE-associated domain
MLTLLSLFAVSFLAATILPLSSEVYFGALIAEEYGIGSLLFWATLGNTLGACVNWWLGTLVRSNYSRFEEYRWIRIKGEEIERAGVWFNRYGKWSLLVAWAPVIGDALTVFAGVSRVPLWQLAGLAGIGKFARYLFIAKIATTLIN